MTVEINIRVPDALGLRLQPYRERLPEILERGLRDVMTEKSSRYQDEVAIAELLASQPTPEQILSIQPSPELQTRVDELLERNKQGILSRQEESELERYLTLEHLIRLAKASAFEQLDAA